MEASQEPQDVGTSIIPTLQMRALSLRGQESHRDHTGEPGLNTGQPGPRAHAFSLNSELSYLYSASSDDLPGERTEIEDGTEIGGLDGNYMELRRSC